MAFRLAPRSTTLDYLELDGGWPPFFKQSSITPVVHMMFGSKVGFSGSRAYISVS